MYFVHLYLSVITKEKRVLLVSGEGLVSAVCPKRCVPYLGCLDF